MLLVIERERLPSLLVDVRPVASRGEPGESYWVTPLGWMVGGPAERSAFLSRGYELEEYSLEGGALADDDSVLLSRGYELDEYSREAGCRRAGAGTGAGARAVEGDGAA